MKIKTDLCNVLQFYKYLFNITFSPRIKKLLYAFCFSSVSTVNATDVFSFSLSLSRDIKVKIHNLIHTWRDKEKRSNPHVVEDKCHHDGLAIELIPLRRFPSSLDCRERMSVLYACNPV